MSTNDKNTAAPNDYRIAPGSGWAGAWRIAGVVAFVASVAAAYGYTLDKERFAYSYLFGFFVPLSLAVGSLFFVMVLYVTKASWGISVRRIAELFMRPMHAFAFLAIPLVLLAPQLMPFMGGGQHGQAVWHKEEAAAAEAAHVMQKGEPSPIAEFRGEPDKEPAAMRNVPVHSPPRMEKAEQREEHEIVEHKRFLMNRTFFYVRLVAYVLLWYWLAQRYFRWSTEQDKTKAFENTAAAQRFAPLGLVIFAVTVTFFAFDWFLSLDATWYSTMFGVQIFAQIALFQMAALVFVAILMRNGKLLGDAVTVEHFHDMGKLLFGWIVFWSYITFAQFFLTWYSNIPDELTFFHKRWHDNGGTWQGVSLALVVFHFFIPFWFLMSRNIKRRLPLLATGALVMMVMHVVEVYWVVFPNYGPLEPSWVDLACLVAGMGWYLFAVLLGMRDYSLVAIGDPRLPRALEFENA